MLYLLQRNIRLIASVTVLISFGNAAIAQSFGVGNLTVLQIGNGSAALSSAASPVSVVEFTPSGTATSVTVALPSTGATKITNSGTASSEGFMGLSAERDRLILVGYDAIDGTSAVVSSASSTVNRELFTITSNGTYAKAASTSTEYSGNNIRSGTASGTNYFSSGAVNGVELFNGNVQLSTSTIKTRVIQIINGQTYFTSNDNPLYDGLNQLGTGIPITNGQTAILISPTSTSPFGFAISPDGNTLYMADDGTGITKYTKSGSTFVSAYLVSSTPARGLAVDFSGTNPILYATTTAASANTIIKMTDAGSAATESVIATAPANTVYQGITFAPSCFASVSAVPSTICSGDNALVIIKGNPTASVSYNINGGSTLTTTIGDNGYDTLHTGALSGNAMYNLVSITTAACASTALTGSVTITVNPLPNAGTITGVTTVVSAGSVIYLTDAAAGGTWSSTNTGVATVNSTGAVYGVTAGAATISYTVTNGCGTVAATKSITSSSPTSVNTAAVEDIAISPNPNNGSFTIKGSLGEGSNEVKMEITDMLGQVIYSKKAIVQNSNINERVQPDRLFANGMYLLNVRSGAKNRMFRIIVKH